MITSQDLARLETELQTEDLNNLKRRRTDNGRDASRNERFCKDCTSLPLEELDVGSIKHHVEKINADIAIAELLQNAILARSSQRGSKEKEENKHHSYHCKKLATRKELMQQLTATEVHRQSDLTKLSIDSLTILPSLSGYGTEKTLKDLSTTIATLKSQAHPLKNRPELMETLLGLDKTLSTIWEGFNRDNLASKSASSSTISIAKSTSKFDRLPRIELPSFNG